MYEMNYECPLNEEKVANINKMLNQRHHKNYRIVQENGQRLYGPPIDNSLPIPQRGCEVFIGRLPRNCYEDELVPMFETIGPIYQLRLMMDFSGTNRGFAFLQYTNPIDAKTATENLDGSQVRDGHSIGVMLSWDNRRLFIGGIPKNKNKRQIMAEMKRVTDKVRDVIVYMSAYNNKNRGFAFVEYETHYAAAMARRRMAPGFKLWNNHEIRVDWADPEPELDEQIMSKVQILHVRNLAPNEEESQLKELFSFDNLHVERVKKIRDFAFIHYETREDAEQALDITHSKAFVKNYPNHKQLQVSWARPQKSAKQSRKRSGSISSSVQLSSPITPLSNQMITPSTPLSLAQSQSDYQLQCYQNSPLSMPLVPMKYDIVNEDKNSLNLFVVWVPIVWLPNNREKDFPFIENSF